MSRSEGSDPPCRPSISELVAEVDLEGAHLARGSCKMTSYALSCIGAEQSQSTSSALVGMLRERRMSDEFLTESQQLLKLVQRGAHQGCLKIKGNELLRRMSMVVTNQFSCIERQASAVFHEKCRRPLLWRDRDAVNGKSTVFINVVYKCSEEKCPPRVDCIQDKPGLQTRLDLNLDLEMLVLRVGGQGTDTTSPIGRIPPEILSEIFLWSLPERPFNRCNSDFLEDSPWVLTHVCSHWRTVSTATHALWSTVFIYIDDEKATLPLDAVRTQVQRARSLRIKFTASEHRYRMLEEEIFGCLEEHAEKWEELRMTVSTTTLPRFEHLHDRIAALRTVSLWWVGENHDDDMDTLDCFETATSLVDVAIGYEWLTAVFVYPLSQLTRYQAVGFWDTHQAVLSMSPALVEVSIKMTFSDLEDVCDWTSPGPVIELSQLRRLYVSHIGVVAGLKTPILEKIAFDLYSFNILVLKVRHFFNQTATTVRSLGTRGRPNTKLARSILQIDSSITEIAFILGYCTRDYSGEDPSKVAPLLDLLSAGDGNILCPQLAHIHIIHTGSSGHPDKIDHLNILSSQCHIQSCALEAVAVLHCPRDMLEPDPCGAIFRAAGGVKFRCFPERIENVMGYWMCLPEWNFEMYHRLSVS
ncbi:hypothetical protein FB45DRAFT_876959 [Roridomyces roridus]|uniref:F-box domain-containing protein n=1 Tax=Roridomyces roridus TaxID=1738132 RepID=A0AAD7FAP7_9AGAR|nr:hypothetical protein FB45DRAFT_876959 [Roridomyces roridus]